MDRELQIVLEFRARLAKEFEDTGMERDTAFRLATREVVESNQLPRDQRKILYERYGL